MRPLNISPVDLVLAAAMIAAGVAALWGAAGLPEPVMEPVGAAAFPRAAGLIVLVFGICLAVAGCRGRRAEPQETGTARRPVLALFFLLLTIVYVAAMDFGWVGFRTATVLYLSGLGAALFGFRPRPAIVSAVIALILAPAVHFLFTRFLFIDLP